MNRKSAVVTAAIVAVASTPVPVAAVQYGPGSPDTFLYWPDNGEHTFHYSNLSPPYHDAANWARVQSVGNGTDMTELYMETPSGVTDVFVFDEALGGTLRGRYSCVSVTWWSATHCESSDAIFNNSVLDAQSANQKSKTACHEFGHSIGLGHTNAESTSCLISGSSENLYFSDHDKSHVNGRF